MRPLAIFLLLVMGAAPALSQMPDNMIIPYNYEPQNQPSPNEGRFDAFGGIFGDLRVGCNQCHGLNGIGSSSGAFPRLAGQSGWYLYKSLRDYAAGLRPSEVMSPIARTLADDQMRNVSAYYSSLENVPYFGESQADVQQLQIGGAIAAAGFSERGVPACSGCHADQSTAGNPIYPDLTGQYAPYLRHQLMLWKSGTRDGDPMNIMEIIAKSLTDDEIHAVALYYASIRPGQTTAGDLPTSSVTAAPDGPEPPYIDPAEGANRPNRATTTTAPPAEQQ